MKIASADRRPVDPPPVVELRILEGDAKTDITFSYNANFFLYTTLENARPIAQGRVPTGTTSFPVLTGMPVAGMAYLDRPGPAGYFIFPDLSVRHEGKYRLSFNLFEELKDPKDADAEPAPGSPKIADVRPINPLAPQSHVCFRLEVKSIPFNVYSAKKFPGLAESTALSRIVAEQGCRVRIRRDVRMRRRDTKSTKGYEEWEEDTGYSQEQTYNNNNNNNNNNNTNNNNNQAFQQPSQAAPRPTSANSTYSSFQQPPQPAVQAQGAATSYTSYPQPQNQTSQPQRPQSQNSVYNPYQHSSPSAAQPQSAGAGYTSHLTFGNSSTTQYSNNSFQPPAPTSQPTQSYVANNNSGYPYPVSMHSRQLSNPQNGGYIQPQTTQPSPQQPTFSQGQSTPSITHPGSFSQPQPLQPSFQPNVQPVSQSIFAQGQAAFSNASNGFSLAPQSQINTAQSHGFRSSIVASTAPEGVTKYSYSVLPPARTGPRTGKRPYGKVFNQEHITQPMHSGMRPNCTGQDLAQIEAEDGSMADEYDLASLKILAYKRADGTRGIKRCPTSLSDSD